jgi:hypothetical protein
VWQYLTNRTIWRDIFIPGLRQSLGLAWWALLLGGAGGAVLGLTISGDRRLRVVGAVALVSGFLFLVTPQLLGLPNDPIFFFANVRYAALPLTLGLILLALTAPGPAWLGGSVLALLFTALDPGVWASGFPVKPFATPIHGSSALVGVLLGAAILVLGLAWVWRDRLGLGRAHRALHRTWAIAGAAGLGTLAVLAGGLISASYARDRYRDTEPLPTLYAWSQHVRGARIGIVGFNEQYPFTGADDSNHVQYIGQGQPHGGFEAPSTCQVWRTAINRSRYDFVVVTPGFFAPVQQAPELRWTQSSPNARAVVRQVDHGVVLGIVFRIAGPLDPSACPGR